jgi:hypothetical protein
MLFPNWSSYFKSRTDNEKGNQNTSIYTTAWAQEVDHATKLGVLIRDPDTILFAADAEGTIISLHSFGNLGGTLLRPSNKLVCLTGSGQMGVAVIVDENLVTADCNSTAPSPDIITACKTVQELKGIDDPTTSITGGSDYDGCNTFLPAPWLLDAFMATNTNKPLELILATTAAAKAFDDVNDDDPAFLIPAKSHLNHFVQWAWGVHREAVPKTSNRLDLLDSALEAFHKGLEIMRKWREVFRPADSQT